MKAYKGFNEKFKQKEQGDPCSLKTTFSSVSFVKEHCLQQFCWLFQCACPEGL